MPDLGNNNKIKTEILDCDIDYLFCEDLIIKEIQNEIVKQIIDNKTIPILPEQISTYFYYKFEKSDVTNSNIQRLLIFCKYNCDRILSQEKSTFVLPKMYYLNLNNPDNTIIESSKHIIISRNNLLSKLADNLNNNVKKFCNLYNSNIDKHGIKKNIIFVFTGNKEIVSFVSKEILKCINIEKFEKIYQNKINHSKKAATISKDIVLGRVIQSISDNEEYDNVKSLVKIINNRHYNSDRV